MYMYLNQGLCIFKGMKGDSDGHARAKGYPLVHHSLVLLRMVVVLFIALPGKVAHSARLDFLHFISCPEVVVERLSNLPDANCQITFNNKSQFKLFRVFARHHATLDSAEL